MKIYIIVENQCRMDRWITKFSFDFIPFKQLLEKAMNEQEGIIPYDYGISEELEKEIQTFNEEQGYKGCEFGFADLLDTYFCPSFDESVDQKRLDSLDKEGFNVVLEESSIGVGNSKEKALAQLHEIDLGEW